MTPEEIDQAVQTAYEQGWSDARYWPHQQRPASDVQRYGDSQVFLVRHVGGDHRTTKLP
jgi:hypothetical protein